MIRVPVTYYSALVIFEAVDSEGFFPSRWLYPYGWSEIERNNSDHDADRSYPKYPEQTPSEAIITTDAQNTTDNSDWYWNQSLDE